ncbi:M4 family metallopeptidase [Paenimyroides aestuarii]|uniref:M4 family metallopeptidase n=1 Tax=Paenimyroides aestuarii TaxID=2968490 RepID=A0ABY5NSV6_9FLAO|nr:M4 family metallopeptidase [Paenimyroides aestuarii]UUV21651.1 M4 family metallopeptidase [Paenimyroides aestuarii]
MMSRTILAALFLVPTQTIFAESYQINISDQTSERWPKPKFQNKLGTFYADFSNFKIAADDFDKNLVSYFNLDSNHSFELIKKTKDTETGAIHYSYQHFFKGIKVHGDLVFLHEKQGKINHLNGQLISFKELAVSEKITDTEVVEIARKAFGVNESATESAIEKYILKKEDETQGLVIKLVKKINIRSLYPLKSIDFIIDAQTGELLIERNKVYKADTPSSSATYFRGTKSMTVDSYNGTYRLMDNSRNIRTLNGSNLDGQLNSDGSFNGFSEYTNATPNFTVNGLKPAVEVHWAMRETYDYYKNIHNRFSFDGNNHIIHNYYDAGAVLGTDENAAAVDEFYQNDVYNGMFYGKGGSSMHPVVSLDIAGHEFSHMVISRNGNGGLDYENESGAINESFADIFGTAIEFYVNDNPNWTIGEGVFKNNVSPNYFRSMNNPNNTPVSAGAPNQPDTYKGTYWQKTTNNPNAYNDYGGVHINSGVGNHWFYLLSMGGNGTNDLGNAYYVNPITIQKAEKIAYRALTNSLSPSATYMDFYNATKIAAETLYGLHSNEWDEVVNAWYAVGIGDAPASTKNIEMQSKLAIYPNPVGNDYFIIESQLANETTFEMFDITGKKIIASQILGSKVTIPTAGYQAGIYLLKFKSNAGEYSHKLIIK